MRRGVRNRVMSVRAPITFLAIMTAASAVIAQPAPISKPTKEAKPVTGLVPEEAPPAVVETPSPLVAPSVPASEMKPAVPPPHQVVEKPTESTQKRPRFDIAIVQALDKVTAETVRFEAPVGQPVRYKSIVITVKACEQSASDEPQDDSIAFMTIDSQPRAAPGRPTPAARQVFKGWMYASSPGLNPLQHPVYDVWMVTCRTSAPVIGATRPK